jgi:DNA polymerase-3 subunit delta'
MSESPESDRLEGSPHPRETVGLVGQHGAEQALLDAYRARRLHHGWILGGEEGIGKATLAYRMAKFVLANPDPGRIRDRHDLSVDPSEPAARQVVAQSHPDLIILRRAWNAERKTFYSEIRAEDARRVVTFFGSTASSGGWRIAIVDAADELNAASANALLKILEEPPRHSLFLIVSHNPARLLPTIRSRCQRLILSPLSTADLVAAAAAARPDIDTGAIRDAVSIARGSVRRTLQLAAGDGVALHQALARILSGLPRLDMAGAHALADSCAGRAGDENFALLLAFLDEWLHERAAGDLTLPVHRLARWAEVWDKARRAAREVEVFNLDRKPFVLSTLSMLAEVSRP